MNLTTHTTLNVQVIHSDFYMPQLNRSRKIWMYYPEGYETADKRYPVIYMHDGQNLFDEATAFDKEWGIDETLFAQHAQCLVVGIESDKHRMTEYNCYSHEEYGKGEGKAYVDFIVQTLKPYIDENFKTKPGRDDTFMAGSSMGGLISLFGALYYPDVFSKLGIFSPSLWIVPNVMEEVSSLIKQNQFYPQQFYFYGGNNEGCRMVENLEEVAVLFQKESIYRVVLKVDAEGEHSEEYWREKFAQFYTWLGIE